MANRELIRALSNKRNDRGVRERRLKSQGRGTKAASIEFGDGPRKKNAEQ